MTRRAILVGLAFGLGILVGAVATLADADAEAKRLKVEEENGAVVLTAVDGEPFDSDTYWPYSIVEMLDNIPEEQRPSWLQGKQPDGMMVVVNIHPERTPQGVWTYKRSFTRSREGRIGATPW